MFLCNAVQNLLIGNGYKHNKITVRTQSLEDSDSDDDNSKINNEESDDEIYDD